VPGALSAATGALAALRARGGVGVFGTTEDSGGAMAARTLRQVARLMTGGAIVLSSSLPAAAQDRWPFELVDVARDAGVHPDRYRPPEGYTAGAALADFDRDGDIDLFVPNAEGAPDLLYRNRGDGVFDEVAAALGVAGTTAGGDKPRSRAALWVDYDGDGRLDLLVAGDAFLEPTDDIPLAWTTPRLYRQRADASFEDASVRAALADLDLVSDHHSLDPSSPLRIFRRHLGSLAAGDLTGDGYPELLIGLWQEAGENKPQEIGLRLLLNTPHPDDPGARRFEDVTIATLAPGVPDPGVDHFGSVWQIVLHDFNADGLPDVYAAVDGDDNHLWLNRGAAPDPARPGVLTLNPFEDVTHDAGVTSPEPETDMGVALGDCDNDGLFDIFITKIDGPPTGGTNDFYHAKAAAPPRFADRTVTAGLSGEIFGVGWGCTFQDFDRDGLVDLAMTNGFNDCRDRPRLLRNSPSGSGIRFADLPAGPLNQPDRGSTILAADLDRDGDQDIIHTLLRTAAGGCSSSAVAVLRNDAPAGGPLAGWLAVRPRSPGANSHALGAIVRVEAPAGAPAQSRLITAGISMAGQEPAEAFFGLGGALKPHDPVRVTIEWPHATAPLVIEGRAEDLTNRVLAVGPCSPLDLAAPYGGLDLFDLLELLNLHAAGSPRADLAPPWGQLDAADALEAIARVESGCP